MKEIPPMSSQEMTEQEFIDHYDEYVKIQLGENTLPTEGRPTITVTTEDVSTLTEQEKTDYISKSTPVLMDDNGNIIRGPMQVMFPAGESSSAVDHPLHYNSHKSGVECITIAEHFPFNLGCVIKYIFRHESKGGVEDLRKALWYLKREIERLNKE